MSSPPYTQSPTALSPPYPSHSQLPGSNASMSASSKKRGSEGGGAPSLKRRKGSTKSISSTAAHPLRQTSFPPDESLDATTPYDARSPSVDSMSLVSGSQVSAAASQKKKRGRKSKVEKAREQTPSAAPTPGGGGGAPTTISGASDSVVRGGQKGSKAAAGEEEEEEVEVAATGQERTAEQKAEEHRLRGMLINAFSPEQFDRYENWRAAGLAKAAVKRLVNATVSQSVTEPVIIGVRSVAKVFIGDIIECARRVQAEWAHNTDEKQTDLPTPAPSPSESFAAIMPDTQPTQVAPLDGSDTTMANTESTEVAAQAAAETARKQNIRYGPLRPDHLREAMRRYKLSMEGGGVGMQGLWHQQQQSGVERFGPRSQGRRLFR